VEHRVEPQVLDEGGTAAPGPAPDDQVAEASRAAHDNGDFAAAAGGPVDIPLNGSAEDVAGFPAPAAGSFEDPSGFAAPPAAGSFEDPAGFAAPAASYQAPAVPPLPASPAPASAGPAPSTSARPVPGTPPPGSPMAGSSAPVPGSYGFAGPAAPVVGAAAGGAGSAADPMRMPPPFSSADSAPSGPISRITSPFAALTRQRGKPRPPKERPARAPQRFQPSGAPRPDSLTGSATQRKAQLILSRVEPWSVMKFSFMISLVGWVVLFVAVAGVYFVLSKLGVFTQIEKTVRLVTSTKTSAGTNAADWFKASRVLGYTMLAGAVNVVLITALSTVGAVVYNLITHLAGGIEVTLKETD
jgi:hypothetical protein